MLKPFDSRRGLCPEKLEILRHRTTCWGGWRCNSIKRLLQPKDKSYYYGTIVFEPPAIGSRWKTVMSSSALLAQFVVCCDIAAAGRTADSCF